MPNACLALSYALGIETQGRQILDSDDDVQRWIKL